ncbi:protein of unknown function [Pedobacter steynii]|uniref:DUF4440 domain-containing protein n=1 Tax=Pedobacter steynii TaxID=430522 RepID=A0A1H0C5R3_9SPHI|nr:nuclear transport factor 2 family protein [Pedobacter steynii]NQX41475.1 nuclear transport factor 2 family protein [Pedobacter steynii]SDN53198.1 protein of unknown function [Pedobacter steynii]
MKLSILALLAFLMSTQVSSAQTKNANTDGLDAMQEMSLLSKKKWDWMSEKNVDSLSALFHEKAVFVHMGGSMSREQELNTIKSGGIHYKKAEIQNVTVNIIDHTAIVLSKIRLLAVVGGNEVTNPFVVTEVYVKQNDKWMLGSLSFTRLLGN